MNNASLSAAEREKTGIKSCIAGMCVNLFLFAVKLAVGTLSASIAVIADGFNNLSDAGSSVVSLVGFKVAGKKPDAKHPFGYGRIEYISALVISFLILMTGVTFLKDSIRNCVHPEALSVGIPVYIGLAVSIAAKIVLGLLTKRTGRRIHSVALVAAGTDSLNDVFATAATVVSLVVFSLSGLNIDGFIGVAVSVLIIKAGIEVVRDVLGPLLGQPADPELVQAINEYILSGDGIVGVHDLVVHNYGPGRALASAHAEVPADCNLRNMHDVIDRIEAGILRDLNIEITIHFDPVDTESEEVAALRSQVQQIVHGVDAQLGFHDFRIVSGPTHTNLIFDIVYPYGCRFTEEEVLHRIRAGIGKLAGTYFAVIHVDHPKV